MEKNIPPYHHDNATQKMDFLNCKAVFQGGGCMAFAYIGAFEQAEYKGIHFSAYAGTSAGSIIAALAAAGASGKDMRALVKETNFSVIGHSFSDLPRALFNKDRGSSSHIEKIVNELLCKVLGSKKVNEVKFKDLKYPLSVVATDLKNHELIEWNTEKNPEDSVAYAVRCSCTIPFYFKPVDGRYVDGGMICNLPGVSFHKSSYDFDSILAFTVEQDGNEKASGLTFWDYYFSVIDGASKLQLKMMGVSSVITIKTKLGVLDFSKFKGDGKLPKEFLEDHKAGVKALENFMNQQSKRTSNLPSSNFTFKNKEQLRTQVLLYSDPRFYKHTEIHVSAINLEWAQRMFLLVLNWVKDGIRVVVYVESEQMDEFVKTSLLDLGVELRESSQKLPIYGYFFHNEKNGKWIAITADMSLEKSRINDQYFVQVSSARCFNSKDDRYLIELMVGNLKSFCSPLPQLLPCEKACLKFCSEENILKIFKNDRAFESCDVEYKELPIDELLFQKSFIIGYSVRCIDVQYGIDYYNSPIDKPSVIVMNNYFSYMVPITVVEEDGKYIVVKGHVRLYYAYKLLKKGRIKVVVIRNYSQKSGMETCPISEVRFSDHTIKHLKRKKASRIFLKNTVEDAFANHYLRNRK